MTIKKISLIFLILLTISLSIYKVSHPILIPTAKILLKAFQDQPKQTSWREQQIKVLNHLKKPITYHATGFKIEAVKALIQQMWFQYSLTDDSLSNYLNTIPILKNIDKEQLLLINKNHIINDQYLYLLSIIYDISSNNINPQYFKELNHQDIYHLLHVSTNIELKLLQLASESAIKNKHTEILAEDIQSAFNKLKNELNLPKKNYPYKKNDFRYKLWLKHFSSTIIKNRTRIFNKGKTDPFLKNQIKNLSIIFEYPVHENELEFIMRFFIKNYGGIFYPNKIKDHWQLQKLTAQNQHINKNEHGLSIIPFESTYRSLIHLFPFKLIENGNLEFHYANIPSKLDIETAQKKSVELNNEILNNVYNTGIGWSIINNIKNNYRAAILDPIALQILAERISNYIASIISISKNSNKTLVHNIHKENLLSNYFFQVNPKKPDVEKKQRSHPTNLFRKHMVIKTDIISNLKNIYNLGYFSGIASVDLNNDNKIDTIIPGNFFIDILINKSNKHTHHRIFENKNSSFTAAYGIDFNSDYLTDIIGISSDGLYFFTQIKDLEFKLSNHIQLDNSFALCANDIDNDNDIDLYILNLTRADATQSSNKLIINNNGKFEVASIKDIESNKPGIACTIYDINQDNLNDILITNDKEANECFIQKKHYSFSNQASTFNLNDSGTGAGLSVIDFNNDQYFDLFITNLDLFENQISNQFPKSNQLLDGTHPIKTETFFIGNNFLIGKRNHFSNQSATIFNATQTGWNWGATFFDYENDGDKDLYVTTGGFYEKTIYDKKNHLFLNHNNKLTKVRSLSKESSPMNSRAVVAADVNDDGKLDLILRNPKKTILFTNSSITSNQWLKVKLVGKKPNTHAINAVITLRLNSNSMQEIILPQTGYLSQEPYIKHFGIGDKKIIEIKVKWPDKKETVMYPPFDLNQLIIIKHPNLQINL